MNFAKLGLDKWLLTNIKQLGYNQPTPVQEKVIPLINEDKNVIAISKTGTGKTASFCLPILNKLAQDPFGVFAVILEPTRELAVQVLEKLKVFAYGFNLRISLIIGGVDITEQLVNLSSIPHIIIATPGRLSYILKESPQKFIDNVKYLVLDEFDQLLNDTIIEDIKSIITFLPEDRKTLFFSATINNKIHTDDFLGSFHTGERPVRCHITSGESESNNEEFILTNKELVQKYILIPEKTKENYLIHLLDNNFKRKSIIIFVSTFKQCHFLFLLLELFSFKVSAIHSKMPQRKRFNYLEKFRANLNNILIATDLASRGLDIPAVDVVINYDLPRDPNDYIHRAGRTARAGKSGTCLNFVSQYDVDLILAIEAKVGIKFDELTVNEEAILQDLSMVSKGIKLAQSKIYETGFDEKIEKRKQKDRRDRHNRISKDDNK